MIKNLSHVSLTYKNYIKVKKFYVNILGLKIVHKFKNKKGFTYGLFLGCGKQTFLEFFRKNNRKQTKFFHFCFNVKNIDEVKKKLIKFDKNIKVKRGKTDKILQIMTQDFEGNLVEFHQFDNKAKSFFIK